MNHLSTTTVMVFFVYPPASDSLGNSFFTVPLGLSHMAGHHWWGSFSGWPFRESPPSDSGNCLCSWEFREQSEMAQTRPVVVLPWPDIYILGVSRKAAVSLDLKASQNQRQHFYNGLCLRLVASWWQDGCWTFRRHTCFPGKSYLLSSCFIIFFWYH